MVIHRSLPGQITLNAKLTLLYHGPLTPDQIVAKGGIAYLQQLPGKQILFNGSVPLVQNDPQRFSGASLVWDGQTWQRIVSSTTQGITASYQLDFSSASTPASLSYYPAQAPDGSQAYILVPKGTQGGEAMFRVLTPLKTVKSTNVLDPSGPDVFYDYEAVGEFTDNGLAAQINNPLNWLPENTYSVPPVIFRYDAQGHPVTPPTLLPMSNPAATVIPPPLAR